MAIAQEAVVAGKTNEDKMDEGGVTHPVHTDESKTPTSALRKTKYSPKTKMKPLARVEDTSNNEASDKDEDAWISRNIQFDKEDDPVDGISGATQLFTAFMPTVATVPPDQRVEEGLHLVILTLHEMDEKSEVHPIDVTSSAPIL